MVPPPRKLSFQYVRHVRPETVLEFLLRRFHYHSAEQWSERIRSGAVTVNGQSIGPGHVLTTKERIVYVPPVTPEPPVDARYTVLYEDPHLIAVGKSGNIPTSPSGKYWHNCLRHVLQRERGYPELYPVHRLDRETSGVNLFAKTNPVAGTLGKFFSGGQVKKTYAAILRGRLPAKEVLVSAPLQDAGSEIQIKQGVHPAGRASVTRFQLRALLPGACLVGVLPVTGRTHQIRAHASFLGTPVWGDHLYGVTDAEFLKWLKNPDRDITERHLLHATELRLPHPVTGEELVVKSNEGLLLEEFLRGYE